MKTIEITEDDYEFLKDLQHELLTQDNDGTADPLFWGVMDHREICVPEGCGDEVQLSTDDGLITLEEAVENINEYIEDEDEEVQEKWKDVDKENANEVSEFAREVLEWDFYEPVDVLEESFISRTASAFLTKRACKEYIDKYAYNHNKPHTYAMRAYRNFEYGRLLKILKSMKLNDDGKKTPKYRIGDVVRYNSFGEEKNMTVANITASKYDVLYSDEDGNDIFESDII